MKQLISLLTIVVFTMVGCQNQPDDSPPAESPAAEEPTEEQDEKIDEEDKKVNEQNGLDDNGGDCPPPADTDQMCAQVVVWALSPEGVCCEYPTPCHAPKGWETFQSADACSDAADGEDEDR